MRQKVTAFARVIELNVGACVTCSFMLHTIYELAKKNCKLCISSEFVIGFDPTIFRFCFKGLVTCLFFTIFLVYAFVTFYGRRISTVSSQPNGYCTTFIMKI